MSFGVLQIVSAGLWNTTVGPCAAASYGGNSQSPAGMQECPCLLFFQGCSQVTQKSTPSMARRPKVPVGPDSADKRVRTSCIGSLLSYGGIWATLTAPSGSGVA